MFPYVNGSQYTLDKLFYDIIATTDGNILPLAALTGISSSKSERNTLE